MRYLTVAFLLCLASNIANAQAFQSRKPVLCDTTKKIIEALGENYKEKPIWIAKDGQDDTRYSLFVNEQTNTWTIIQFTPEHACILGVGEDSKIILGDKI